MRALPLVFALAALGFAAAAAAQPAGQGQRITGTVASVSASEVVITTSTGPVQVGLSAQTRIAKREDARADDIVPGAYLGTANQTSADGASGTSTEVHLMPDGGNVNVPMNNSGLVMTNGHVKSVKTTAAGREIDIDYGQAATRHVVVPAGTPTTRMAVVASSALAVGQAITAAALPGADGKPVASFIVINSPPAR